MITFLLLTFLICDENISKFLFKTFFDLNSGPAIKKIKQRVLRGRNPSKLSVGEKERVEKFVAKKKGLINRLAMKMLPRVRQLEKKRMANARKRR